MDTKTNGWDKNYKKQEKAEANMVQLPFWIVWFSGFSVGLVAGAAIVLVMVL